MSKLIQYIQKLQQKKQIKTINQSKVQNNTIQPQVSQKQAPGQLDHKILPNQQNPIHKASNITSSDKVQSSIKNVDNKEVVISPSQPQNNTPESIQGFFRGLKFCFPFFNVELSEARGKSIQNTIQKFDGEVFGLSDLKEMNDDVQISCFLIDFMLVGSEVCRQHVERLIPSKIKYHGILDYNYIFQCINKRKLLDYKSFLIPQQEVEFKNYLKIKEKEIKQENQRNLKVKHYTKYGAGIQPIQFNHPYANHEQKKESQLQNNCDEDQNGLVNKPEDQPKQQKYKAGTFNELIFQSFQKMAELFESTDRGRSFSYNRVANVIKSSEIQIMCENDVDKFNGTKWIGPKTIQKIKEFVRNGSIQKLNILESKPIYQASQKLQRVWGIGKVRAEEIYAKGINSIIELREAVENKQISLTKNQLVGLKYYEDLDKRIPRQKVQRMFDFIKRALAFITGDINIHKIEVCGSFRRGAPTCGDIDIIISRKDGIFQPKLIYDLVERLQKDRFITDHLAMPRNSDAKTSVSYMGICQFEDSCHHRVDLKYYPISQFAYAILYFTGSDMFNKNMRLYAMKQGFSLSDHRMCRAEKLSGNIITEGPNILCETEQDIFKELGIKYKSPSERCI